MFWIISSFLLRVIDCSPKKLSAEHLQPSGKEPFSHKEFDIQLLEVTFLDPGPFFVSEEGA